MSGSPSTPFVVARQPDVTALVNGVARGNCLYAGSRAEGTDYGKTAGLYKAFGNAVANPLRNVLATHG